MEGPTITISIEAIEPGALIETPSTVFVRATEDNGAHGPIIELHGELEAVARFVADKWGAEQVQDYPELDAVLNPHASGLDSDARMKLNDRATIGEECMAIADGGGIMNRVEGEDRETAASDAVSDILTALFGPAGRTVEKEQPDPDGPGLWGVDGDVEAQHAAEDFLDRAYRSWQGDAEDYTVPREVV